MLCKKHLSESTQPRWCCRKSLKNIHAEKHCSGITAVKGNISEMFFFSVLWYSLAFISKMKLFLHDFSTLSKALSWCVLILSKSILQPSNKNTHKANHWVYNPSISYDGKQTRPQGAISSAANKNCYPCTYVNQLKGMGIDSPGEYTYQYKYEWSKPIHS